MKFSRPNIYADNFDRITKLMGESFKLYSEALVGYITDPAATGSSASTPAMSSQGGQELSMEADY